MAVRTETISRVGCHLKRYAVEMLCTQRDDVQAYRFLCPICTAPRLEKHVRGRENERDLPAERPGEHPPSSQVVPYHCLRTEHPGTHKHRTPITRPDDKTNRLLVKHLLRGIPTKNRQQRQTLPSEVVVSAAETIPFESPGVQRPVFHDE